MSAQTQASLYHSSYFKLTATIMPMHSTPQRAPKLY